MQVGIDHDWMRAVRNSTPESISKPTTQIRIVSNPGSFRELFWCFVAPARVKEGATAVIIGFQGAHRQVGQTTLTVNLTAICDRVTASSTRHLILVDEDLARVSVKVNQSLDELGPLGGMSGSPVFTMDEESYANLVGFLYETGEGADATIFAAHADLLTPEGKLDYSRINW